MLYNYSHITFSTKGRVPYIDEGIQDELFHYIGGICRSLDFKPIKIGGYKEHIHILCVLSRKIALMKFIEEVKAHSSKWMKTNGDKYASFYWQRGYGSFSVNPSDIDVVKEYIENQAVHHRNRTFREEFLEILHEYNIEYDERYLWD